MTEELKRALREMVADDINDYTDILILGINQLFPDKQYVDRAEIIAFIEAIRKRHNDFLLGDGQ